MIVECLNCSKPVETGKFLGVELFINPGAVGVKVNMVHEKCLDKVELSDEEQIKLNTTKLKANQVLTAPIKE